ncbi:MAG: hypothetical protein AAB955_00470, partial [Patescibacteria group bacterium]
TKAWGIIRDLGNIMIIAGFVAVGISTILQIGTYAADKFLTKLIIAALLINFSYFFAGAIIDASNFIATRIFLSNVMNADCHEKGFFGHLRDEVGSTMGSPPRGTDRDGAGTADGGYEACSIGSAFNSKLRLGTWDEIEGLARSRAAVTETESFSDLPEEKRTNVYFQLFLLYFFGTIFNIIAGVVFFMACLMFVVRFVVLVLLLITSPIGVAGINIPYISTIASRWWSALISQSIFAPVYLLLVGISLTLIEAMAVFMKISGESYSNSVGRDGSQIAAATPLILTFMVSIGFMVLALIIARMIASSAQEFKGIYDMAYKQGNTLAWMPKRLMFDLPAGRIRSLLEHFSSGMGGPSTFIGARLANLAGAIRWTERAGSGKKHEKGVFEESAGRAQRIRDNTDAASKTGGWWDQPAWKKGRGLSQGIFGRGLVYKNPNDLTDDEKKELGKDLQSEKIPDLINKFGKERVKGWAEVKDILSDAQIVELNKGNAFTKEEKSAINKKYFQGLTDAINGGDTAAVRKTWSKMSDDLRKLWLAENKELKQGEAFLAALDHKEFKAVVEGGEYSEKEAKDAGDRRIAGLRKDLAKAREDADPAKAAAGVRRVYDRMSNDEKLANRDLLYDEKTHKMLTPAQARDLHESLPPHPDPVEQKREEDTLDKNHPRVIERGTSFASNNRTQTPSETPKPATPEPESTGGDKGTGINEPQ